MSSLYDWFMKPLEKRGIKAARTHLIPQAKGQVLEIGSGTGANIPFYQFEQIKELTITDKTLSKHITSFTPHDQIVLVEADVLQLPFEDNSFDTIVHTLVFCSVNDVTTGLSEVKRVLKDDGTLIFIEHVLPQKKGLRRLFKTVNPVWKTVASGCNLTRDYLTSLEQLGFHVTTKQSFMNTVFVSGTAVKQ